MCLKLIYHTQSLPESEETLEEPEASDVPPLPAELRARKHHAISSTLCEPQESDLRTGVIRNMVSDSVLECLLGTEAV